MDVNEKLKQSSGSRSSSNNAINTSLSSHHLKPIDMNLIREQLASSKNVHANDMQSAAASKQKACMDKQIKSSVSSDSIKTTNSRGSNMHGENYGVFSTYIHTQNVWILYPKPTFLGKKF